MNKSESKYYHTALLMNQALIELLNQKAYDFITIKEICQKAGVNRSTFYLHYDNVGDLLEETITNINQKFMASFTNTNYDILQKIAKGEKKSLIFVTPEYLQPYLNHIKQNKVVYQVYAKHPTLMKATQKFHLLCKQIVYPILVRFGIPADRQKYLAAFYINGIYAMIDEWIQTDCQDEIDLIMDAIMQCVHSLKNHDEE